MDLSPTPLTLIPSPGSAPSASTRLSRWDHADWRSEAACHDFPTELFFPVGEGHQTDEQVRAAKNVCASCPAAHSCLEFAIATYQNDGIWGGTSEEERRLIKRGRRAAARRAVAA